MIKCKAYNTVFLTPITCIERQKEVAFFLKKIEKIKKKGKRGGNAEIRESTPNSRFFSLKACIGCKIGIREYEKWKKKNGKKEDAPKHRTYPA